jgi:single-stranded DNA-binding protein
MSGIEAAFFGSLARGAETKISKGGKQYLRLSVRVGDGDAVQWVSVLAFDETAAAVPEKFLKGARVYVEGSIRIEEWTTQDGAKRSGLSCMSWHCRLSEIGRNRPKRDRKVGDDRNRSARPPNPFHDDPTGL